MGYEYYRARRDGTIFPSQREETMSVELLGDTPPKTKKSGVNNQEFNFSPKQYSFKDEQVVTIFHLLKKGIS